MVRKTQVEDHQKVWAGLEVIWGWWGSKVKRGEFYNHVMGEWGGIKMPVGRRKRKEGRKCREQIFKVVWMEREPRFLRYSEEEPIDVEQQEEFPMIDYVPEEGKEIKNKERFVDVAEFYNYLWQQRIQKKPKSPKKAKIDEKDLQPQIHVIPDEVVEVEDEQRDEPIHIDHEIKYIDSSQVAGEALEIDVSNNLTEVDYRAYHDPKPVPNQNRDFERIDHIEKIINKKSRNQMIDLYQSEDNMGTNDVRRISVFDSYHSRLNPVNIDVDDNKGENAENSFNSNLRNTSSHMINLNDNEVYQYHPEHKNFSSEENANEEEQDLKPVRYCNR
jgi:hypothetical protein